MWSAPALRVTLGGWLGSHGKEHGAMDLAFLSDPATYISLLTLTLMEVVLGIDNIVFITILCGKLPKEVEHKARRAGIALALVSRLLLLFSISWVMRLTQPLFTLVDKQFSGKSLILLGGGLFLIAKATHEIFENVEHPETPEAPGLNRPDMAGVDQEMAQAKGDVGKQFAKILAQVVALDIVFSLDSVITAVGMVQHLPIMVAAMLVSVAVMLIFANPVGDFVQNNPSVRILALAFLVLIGVMLLMEGMGQHVSKGYIYSAIGFSLFVQMINLRREKKIRASKHGSAH
jgi:predicted tellurium resistance membrane protein TerC